MPKNLSHDEIAQRFVEAKVIDFTALGKWIGELGPALAINDHGLHGAIFGRFNYVACMLQAIDVERLVGNLRAAGLTANALENVEGRLAK
jgi:hypothetical protein